MSDKLIAVAGISNNFKLTMKQVRKVLELAAIDCYFEGSIAYDILVQPEQKQAASYILRNLQKTNPAIVFLED